MKGVRSAAARAYYALRGPDDVTLRKLIRAGRVSFGEGSYGVPTLRHYDNDSTRLVVGKYTSIARGCVIVLGGNHPIDRATTYPFRVMWSLPGKGLDGYPESRGDIYLGSDVWIGTESLILSGVRIGDGAVIAAGAVVPRDVPPYAVVAGNPGRVVRYRFPATQREALLSVKWWNWPRDEILDAVPLLAGDDVGRFLEYALENRGGT